MGSKSKPWNRKRGSKERKINTRNPRDKILIVCEGEKTEPNYFRAFPIDKEIVEVDIHGAGMNTDSLVNKSICMRNEAEKRREPYNRVWCVFDRDSFPKQKFNSAIKLANSNKIKVAYSNQAFELWYLLHFNYVESALDRKHYKEKLKKELSHPYRKNSRRMYAELLDKQSIAIRNAKKLLNTYFPINPEANNPSTTVHKLVEELNKLK